MNRNGRKPRVWTEAEKARARRLYETEFCTIAEIAEELGACYSMARKCLLAAGVRLRSRSYRREIAEARTKLPDAIRSWRPPEGVK